MKKVNFSEWVAPIVTFPMQDYKVTTNSIHEVYQYL